jgi:predicted metal-dependent hydrolase
MELQADWTPLEKMIPKDLLRSEVDTWARRIRVEPKEIHVRPMKRKWGSCSTAGRLSFNTELLTAPTKVRKRVIVEELLHLKVPNHGKLFKALLKAYLGKE